MTKTLKVFVTGPLCKGSVLWKTVHFLMMTSSNGNIFRVTGPLCGNSPVTGEFPSQRPVMRSFDVFFDLCLNKRLSKQSWGWWLTMTSRSLWRRCNADDIMTQVPCISLLKPLIAIPFHTIVCFFCWYKNIISYHIWLYMISYEARTNLR